MTGTGFRQLSGNPARLWATQCFLQVIYPAKWYPTATNPPTGAQKEHPIGNNFKFFGGTTRNVKTVALSKRSLDFQRWELVCRGLLCKTSSYAGLRTQCFTTWCLERLCYVDLQMWGPTEPWAARSYQNTSQEQRNDSEAQQKTSSEGTETTSQTPINDCNRTKNRSIDQLIGRCTVAARPKVSTYIYIYIFIYIHLCAYIRIYYHILLNTIYPYAIM